MTATTTTPEPKAVQSPRTLFNLALAKAARDTLDGEVVIRVKFRGGVAQGTQVTVSDNFPQPKGGEHAPATT